MSSGKMKKRRKAKSYKRGEGFDLDTWAQEQRSEQEREARRFARRYAERYGKFGEA